MHTLALGLLKQQKEPVSRASGETGTCFSAAWALSEPGATVIIWKAYFSAATLKAFQVSLCDRKDWDGIGFRLPQSRDCCSEEKVLLFAATHLGPIAASYLGREDIPGGLRGSPSSLGSFDGQDWRLGITCGGMAQHGYEMASSYSL